MFEIDVTEGIQSKDLIENGAWLHLRGIAPPGEEEGEPIYLKDAEGKPDKTKPFRAMVRSVRSEYFRARDLRIQTLASSKAQRAPRREQDAIIESSVAAERPKRFSFLLVCFENASQKVPGVQKPSEEELITFAKQGEYQFIVDQVMRFAFEDRNYGTAEQVAAATGGNVEAPAAAALPAAGGESGLSQS
jgi:hypothetical protein